MKRFNGIFAVLIGVLMVAVFAVTAGAGDLVRTPGWMLGGGTPVQVFGPDGGATSSTAVTTQTMDLSSYILYAVYSGSGTCFERLMPASGSDKASYVKTPIPNTTWHIRAVNTATPFLNVSGCVAGFVRKQ